MINHISDVLDEKNNYRIYGRVIGKRNFGDLVFLDIKDKTGKIQLVLEHPEVIPNFGDIIQVNGNLFYTKTRTKSLKVDNLSIESRCKIPAPDKHNLTNILDFENRTQALTYDMDLFRRIKKRYEIVNQIRSSLSDLDYLEVETPILVTERNTSKAESFVTYCNSLNMNLFLRKTPEFYLKALIIAGFEAVFEVGKNFRNENISRFYQPEFTVLEAYNTRIMDSSETLILILSEIERNVPDLSRSIINDLKEFSYERFMTDNLKGKLTGNPEEDFALMISFMKQKRNSVYLIKGFPIAISPLASTRDDYADDYADDYKLFVDSIQISDGAFELTDPDEQVRRFVNQASKLGINYNPKEDPFIHALRQGMPSCSGFGLGIDHIVQFYTNAHNIREVISFPK